MPDEIKPNVNEAPTHDAQLAAENIATGEEKAPAVDLEADYAAAQKFSVSDVDRTGQGAAAAEASTASKQKVPEAREIKTQQIDSTGNPDDYAELAKEVGNAKTEGVADVSDDLVEKALEKGQPK
ncbi:MAG: hypothetical protein RMX96_11865 [Nostoc sp. ChiSLP02]|nr:hypothetical protein [Nostoc sp. DedSLP05]MDZ8103484.1 hypothetical protein [Nostoc sp. DedSLP01]MDZ8185536.1 hypothetical protein [Nostoc sp. ChiSLP02]